MDLFVIILVFVLIVLYVKNHMSEVTYVKAKNDDQTFLVRRLPDKQQAADLLADITNDLTKFVNQLTAKYPANENIKRLYRNFNPKNVSEGSVNSGYTSYSVNKGEKMVLCIRQKDEKNSFVDKNVILYVAIHELAHLATKSVGHDDSFWTNFKFILGEAVEMGIYKKVDFSKAPASYCGINITSSVI
jgi:hypothetical protein